MGSGASIASSLAPTGVAAAVIVCPPAGLAAGAIFGAGVAVGAAWGANKDKPTNGGDDDALDALDAVGSAAEAVMEYLHAAKDAALSPCEGAMVAAAARALEKLKEAAESVVDRVASLLRRLFGLKKAAAARCEMHRAALHAGCPDAFAKAAARVARSRRCITEAAAASLAIVPAAGAVAPAIFLRRPGPSSPS